MNLFEVEEIVEELNADIELFFKEVLKVEQLSSKNNELPLESSCFKIVNSVNETKGSLNAKSSSTDNSKDDSSKPAPQKSPQGNNVLDDFTEANNNVSDSADTIETTGSTSGQEKLK